MSEEVKKSQFETMNIGYDGYEYKLMKDHPSADMWGHVKGNYIIDRNCKHCGRNAIHVSPGAQSYDVSDGRIVCFDCASKKHEVQKLE